MSTRVDPRGAVVSTCMQGARGHSGRSSRAHQARYRRGQLGGRRGESLFHQLEDVQPACFGLFERPRHQRQVESFAFYVELEGGDRLGVPRDLWARERG